MTRWPDRLAPPVFAADTQARAFWQSRSGLRDPPALTDLAALALDVRKTWPTTATEPPATGAEESANEIHG